MLLELLQCDVHLRSRDLEACDLLLLLLNDRIGDHPHKAEVLLDARQMVLWGQSSQVRHFALDVEGLGPDKDIELFTLNQVWTAGHLPDEEIEQEAALSDELTLGVADGAL